jgi:C-methyltransferase
LSGSTHDGVVAELVQSSELAAVSKIKEVAWGLASTGAVVAAVRLGVAEALGDEPARAEEVADRIGVDADALTRLLDALAYRGVFVRDDDGRYRHNELSRLLRVDDPNSVSYLVQWIGASCLWPVWPKLDESVRTGKAVFPGMYGKEVFDYVHGDEPETGVVLNHAMTQASNHTSAAIAEALDLDGVATIADIGGGHGHLLRTILERYPGVQGVLLDLESVVAGVTPLLREGPLAARCAILSGDCRTAVPVKADLYIAKNILEWKDEYTIATLRNIAASAAPGARVILIETLVDHTPEPAVTTALDLLLLLNVAGRKHSSAHVAELYERSGLRFVGVRGTGTFLSFAEGAVVG